MGGFYFLLAIIIFGIVFFKDRGARKYQKQLDERDERNRAMKYNPTAAQKVKTRNQVPARELLRWYLESWIGNGTTLEIHPSLDKYLPEYIRENILFAYDNELGRCRQEKILGGYYGIENLEELFYLILCKEANKNPYMGQDYYISVDDRIENVLEILKYEFGTKGVVKKYK